MNKLLHGLVYVFLVLAGAALYFELDLNAKRSELTARNRLQEDYLVKIAKTIEKAEPSKDAAFEIKKDSSPVEARLVDSPDMENVLDEYQGSLEQTNLETWDWENQRDGLRSVYVLDPEGKPVMDGNQPQTRGSEEQKMLEQLFNSAKDQQSHLNSTRSALADLRAKLESVVNEINKLKPEARQDKVTIAEKEEKISTLEKEKTEVENKVTKLKSQIDELNTEIASKTDELTTAKDEVEAAKEDMAKAQKLIDQLKQMLKESIPTQGAQPGGQGGSEVVALPAGENKGTVIEADNTNMFVIVEFTSAAMKELKGEDLSKPLPALELGVRRPGFKGEAGEFIGRIRLRQEVKGKPYVICDILNDWKQVDIERKDVIFAD